MVEIGASASIYEKRNDVLVMAQGVKFTSFKDDEQ